MNASQMGFSTRQNPRKLRVRDASRGMKWLLQDIESMDPAEKSKMLSYVKEELDYMMEWATLLAREESQ